MVSSNALTGILREQHCLETTLLETTLLRKGIARRKDCLLVERVPGRTNHREKGSLIGKIACRCFATPITRRILPIVYDNHGRKNLTKVQFLRPGCLRARASNIQNSVRYRNPTLILEYRKLWSTCPFHLTYLGISCCHSAVIWEIGQSGTTLTLHIPTRNGANQSLC